MHSMQVLRDLSAFPKEIFENRDSEIELPVILECLLATLIMHINFKIFLIMKSHVYLAS